MKQFKALDGIVESNHHSMQRTIMITIYKIFRIEFGIGNVNHLLLWFVL